MYVLTCAPSLVWWPEDKYGVSLLIRLKGKHCYPLSHLISPVMRISTVGNRSQGLRAKQGEDIDPNKEREDLTSRTET